MSAHCRVVSWLLLSCTYVRVQVDLVSAVVRCMTYVVHVLAVLPVGDDLNGGMGSFGDIHGDVQMGEAEVALAGDVGQVRGEGHVEVGDVGALDAKTQVDVDVGPGVAELEGDGAAGEGPVSTVASVVANTGA